MQAVARRSCRLLLLAAALTVSACGKSSTEPDTGHELDVRYGATVTIPSDTTSVRFLDVPADSRCPAAVQCVWAGEAVAQFLVGGTQLMTLTLGADASRATTVVRSTRITLTALKPAPTAADTLRKSDYVATLRFVAVPK